jgi:hypothetical protein
MILRLLVSVLLGSLISCSTDHFPEGAWIDKEKENTLLMVDRSQGRTWIRFRDRSGIREPIEIVSRGGEAFVNFNANRQDPILIDRATRNIEFRDREYIPFSESWKGRFSGHWKSNTYEMAFKVGIDTNMDLYWDLYQGADPPIRFWPKRTDDGFYFTRDGTSWSFTLEEGVLVDWKGNRYEWVPEM